MGGVPGLWVSYLQWARKVGAWRMGFVLCGAGQKDRTWVVDKSYHFFFDDEKESNTCGYCMTNGVTTGYGRMGPVVYSGGPSR